MATADIRRATSLDNKALWLKNGGVEELTLKAGRRAPDFGLLDPVADRLYDIHGLRCVR